jgi:hypothetical protein
MSLIWDVEITLLWICSCQNNNNDMVQYVTCNKISLFTPKQILWIFLKARNINLFLYEIETRKDTEIIKDRHCSISFKNRFQPSESILEGGDD